MYIYHIDAIALSVRLISSTHYIYTFVMLMFILFVFICLCMLYIILNVSKHDVEEHIHLLHQYNEIKDIVQELMGKLVRNT